MSSIVRGLKFRRRDSVLEYETAGKWRPAELVPSVLHYGAVGDGSTDDAAAIAAALSENDVVLLPEPAVAYRINSTIVMPSNKRLVGVGGAIPVIGSAAFLFDFAGTVDSEISGVVITGPHTGTSYQIRLSGNAARNKFSLKIQNGNSGIHVLDSQDNEFDLELVNMRGTGLNFDGVTTTGNYARRVECVNVVGFGLLMEEGASRNKAGFVAKRLDAATVTAYMIANHASDLAAGRLGLEAVGLRFESDHNTVETVHCFDSADNGVSITGAYNTFGCVKSHNADNDGVHIYGSGNSVGNITATDGEQSACGIGEGATEGLAANNTVGCVASTGSDRYAVEITGVATGNRVGNVTSSGDTLGKVLNTATLAHTNLVDLYESVKDVDIPSTITWDGTPPSNPVARKYSWQRRGNTVDFDFRLEYGTPGASNTLLTVVLPSDMPRPVALSGVAGGSEIAKGIIGLISAAVTVGVSTPGLPKPASLRDDGSGVWSLHVNLNSASISALLGHFSGSYTLV